MFHFSFFVIFASLPCGYFSSKIQNLPLSYEDARFGDTETLCDWFCSDDLYDYDESSELLPGPGGRASPRIFCDLCEEKKPATSTIKVDISTVISLPINATTEKPAVLSGETETPSPQQPAQSPQQPAQSPQQPAQSPQQPAQSPQQPAQSPQQPIQPPQQPVQSPQTPVQSPQQPVQSPQQPSGTPSEPQPQPTGR